MRARVVLASRHEPASPGGLERVSCAREGDYEEAIKEISLSEVPVEINTQHTCGLCQTR